MRNYMKFTSYKKIFFIVMFLFASTSFASHPYVAGGDYWHTDYKTLYSLAPCPYPCFCPKILESGLYVGAGLGYDSYRIRETTGFVATDGDIFTLNQLINPIGRNGSVFAGYGQYYDWFYIAGEIFAKGSTAAANDTIAMVDLTYNTRVNVRYTYGIAILPGVRLSNASLLYVRLGAMRTMMKIQEYGSGVFEPDALFTSPRLPWLNGISLGIGLETAIYKSFSVRAEYNHTSYASFTSLLSSKFSPSNNEASLSLLYHFDLIC